MIQLRNPCLYLLFKQHSLSLCLSHPDDINRRTDDSNVILIKISIEKTYTINGQVEMKFHLAINKKKNKTGKRDFRKTSIRSIYIYCRPSIVRRNKQIKWIRPSQRTTMTQRFVGECSDNYVTLMSLSSVKRSYNFRVRMTNETWHVLQAALTR